MDAALTRAVKKLIKGARKSGTVTLAEVNGILPDDTVSPEQIEAVMAQIEEAGLEIVENKEPGRSSGDAGSSGDDDDDAPETAPEPVATTTTTTDTLGEDRRPGPHVSDPDG